MIVNRGMMAGILGISEPTLDRMVQRREVIGRKKGNVWEFDTKAVIERLKRDAGRGSKASKKTDTELRISLAEAELKEFKVAEQRKITLTVDDMAPLVEEQMAVVRSKVRALPGRVNQRLAIETDPAEVLRLLKNAVADVLDEITEAEAPVTYKPKVAKPVTPASLEADEDDEMEGEDEDAGAPREPAFTDDGY